ncbi:MAG: hypothetical protein J0H68_06690 [Sphingobacteriia bacterium]|nr:hypothetical protein [Sphingobacteriia bacterium]
MSKKSDSSINQPHATNTKLYIKFQLNLITFINLLTESNKKIPDNSRGMININFILEEQKQWLNKKLLPKPDKQQFTYVLIKGDGNKLQSDIWKKVQRNVIFEKLIFQNVDFSEFYEEDLQILSHQSNIFLDCIFSPSLQSLYNEKLKKTDLEEIIKKSLTNENSITNYTQSEIQHDVRRPKQKKKTSIKDLITNHITYILAGLELSFCLLSMYLSIKYGLYRALSFFIVSNISLVTCSCMLYARNLINNTILEAFFGLFVTRNIDDKKYDYYTSASFPEIDFRGFNNISTSDHERVERLV